MGLILGNGMSGSSGGFNWFFNEFTHRSAPKTAFELNVTYESGETETVISDTETLTAPSPIIFDDLHYGEYHDARLEIPDWNMPEFDDSGWARALKTEIP